MAVYGERQNGKTRYRIQFYDRDNNRRSVRLRGSTRKGAEEIDRHIDRLNSAKISGEPLPKDTAAWVVGLGDDLHAKLVKVELVQPRDKVVVPTIQDFISAFIAGHPKSAKNTIRLWKDTQKKLVDYFGVQRRMDQVSPGQADSWVQSLVNKPLAPATVSKLLKRAKQFFRAAHRNELIEQDPFSDLKPEGEENPDRKNFVERATVGKVLAAAPDAEWRLLIALVRYGGLRNPSETLKLEWSNINWETQQMTVTSPKTKRHRKGFRVVPIFPELLPYLEAAYDAAPEGARYVISRYRSAGTNLRTSFERIICRAGVEPWERLFHNLRASRQTELSNCFPAHVVSDWMGNTVAVAEAHYLMTIPEHHQQAISRVTGGATAGAEMGQQPVPQADARTGSGRHAAPQTKKQQKLASASPCVAIDCENGSAPPVGLEYLPETTGNSTSLSQGGATAGASQPPAHMCDEGFLVVLEAWPRLLAATKSAIIALVRADGRHE